MPPISTETAAHSDVHDVLRRHILADGFSLVFDLESSHGSWVVDKDSGTNFLDLFSFFASLPLGFNHPVFSRDDVRRRLLAAAIHKPSNSDAYTPALARFVDTFSRHAMGDRFRHAFFIEGGALAVENALKTAFDWKARKNLAAGRSARGSRILHFRQAFHGRTGYTLSLTNTDPVKTQHFPQFDWPRVDNPKVRFPLDEAQLEAVAATEAESVRQIEEAFDVHLDDIAAIIIEPIQGEGGDNHFRPQFLAQLRRLADEREALLIFDEVQTGFGLTGSFWTFEQLGVTPDIVCFGKKSQVCGIAVSDRIDDVPDNVFRVPSRINSTWGGNLVDMVRCEVILETMASEDLVAHAADVGAYLLDGLDQLARSHPDLVDNVRGRGLFCAFDLPDAGAVKQFRALALAEKVLILPCGERSIRFRPALTIQPADINIGLEAIDRVLTCMAR